MEQLIPDNDARIKRWRLLLGKNADPEDEAGLTGDMLAMDQTLEALYDSDRKGGLGSSSPKINRWLGDIRQYFPSSVVQVMLKDAYERLDLKQLLFEKEILDNIEPDVDLVATLLSLNRVMPEKTRETARQVVRKVTDQLVRKLREPMRQAVQGSLSRQVRNTRPRINEIDWSRTIRANLKHYQQDYKSIIPHQLIGYGKKGQALREVILCVDQSGSMASSVVYASVFAAVMASIPALKTQMVVFDTSVADLTKDMKDPVDLLFGVELGGGTDINKALGYCQGLIRTPADTILILISDLFEGGNAKEMIKKAAAIKASGAQMICLLSLSDDGKPIFDSHMAQVLTNLDIPCFGCTPDAFPDLMATALRRDKVVNPL